MLRIKRHIQPPYTFGNRDAVTREFRRAKHPAYTAVSSWESAVMDGDRARAERERWNGIVNWVRRPASVRGNGRYR